MAETMKKKNISNIKLGDMALAAKNQSYVRHAPE